MLSGRHRAWRVDPLAHQELLREGGFSQIETRTAKHPFVLPSFDVYYGPFERGGASTGQTLAAPPDEIRRAVRDGVRRDFGDTSGPIEAEYRIASGQRSAATHPPVPPAPSPGRMWLGAYRAVYLASRPR